MGLSHTAEDYLEQIYLLSLRLERVRTTDIARAFGIRTPSVISALKTLRDKGFVHYERYGDVSLSEKGLERALALYERHKTLYRFLHFFLGVTDETASSDACGMEHFLSQETESALKDWSRFVTWKREHGQDLKQEFQAFRSERSETHDAHSEKGLTLASLPVGASASVARIDGEREIRRRLLDMGVIPGTNLIVRNRGPLGYPMEIMVQDFVLSLRKDEAECVWLGEVTGGAAGLD